MAGALDTEVERFFAGHPDALEAYRAVVAMLEPIGPFDVRVTTSQVSFWRRKAFAWLRLPGRWHRSPCAEVVLSVALGERDPSPKLEEVVNPAPSVWMHHLEIRAPDDLDDEVEACLRRAYERAV